MIEETHQLEPKTLEALFALLARCKAADQFCIATYPHLLKTHRAGIPSFLHYDKTKLVGFLGFFQFYLDAAEVALCVDPAFRRQGIAKQLWQSMCDAIEAHKRRLQHMIITTPKDIHATWLKTKDFAFEYTEYEMWCTPYAPKVGAAPQSVPRKATEEDIPFLCEIDAACFNPDRPFARDRIEKLLAHEDTQVFILFCGEQIVGQVHLLFEAHQVRLTDLAVLPKMQRQGFGQQLLNYSLHYVYSHAPDKKITLSVAAKNQFALQLYQSVGFQTYNAIDYYKRRFSLDRF